jgi:hypothetical protein
MEHFFPVPKVFKHGEGAGSLRRSVAKTRVARGLRRAPRLAAAAACRSITRQAMSAQCLPGVTTATVS